MVVRAERPSARVPLTDPDGAAEGERHAHRRLLKFTRPLSTVVFLVLVAASLAGALAMHNVVRDTEHRLLRERSLAVAAILSSTVTDMAHHTEELGSVAGTPDAGALFAARLQSQKDDGVISVGAAVKKDGTFRVGPSASVPLLPMPPTGQPLPALLGPVVTRAANTSGPVADLIPAGQYRILVIARYVSPFVVWQATGLPGTTTQVEGTDTPFRDLKGALFLGRVLDDQHVLMTTEQKLPVSGRTQSTILAVADSADAKPVGDNVFTLVTGSVHPMVGSWTGNMPWMVLASGLVIAFAVGTALNVLSRRRDYARAQVKCATAELAETNRELHSAQRFLDRLVAAGPVVVLRVDAENCRATYASANLESRLGFTSDEALQPGFLWDHVDPSDRARLQEQLHALDAGSSPTKNLEVRLRLPDGSSHWVSVLLVAEPDLPGEYLVYVQDVDVQRRAEQAQQAAVEAAQAANRSKSEFVSRMSHELRTPLNAVLGYSQLLQMDELTETQSQAVEHILSGGRHLLGLINEILDISAIESGRLELHLEPVDVHTLTASVVAMVQPFADKAGITVISKVRPGCVATADAQRTRQVLLNLLTNAVKYNKPSGKVSITCGTSSDGLIQLSVSDTGIGIAEEQIELAFAPFERLDAQQTDVEGTGIGLWLSRRLADAMGGSLTCTSAVGAGTTFTLALLCAEPEPEADADSETSGDDRSIVLHIDDHAPNRDLVEMIFARRGDINLVNASLGAEGLRVAAELHPSVVLLDLHLPDIDGREVLRRLRENPATADIPVVVLSADATPEQIERLVTEGAAVYLTKPVDIDELLTVVHDLVGAP